MDIGVTFVQNSFDAILASVLVSLLTCARSFFAKKNAMHIVYLAENSLPMGMFFLG